MGVVNEVVAGGWLEHLGQLEFENTEFSYETESGRLFSGAASKKAFESAKQQAIPAREAIYAQATALACVIDVQLTLCLHEGNPRASCECRAGVSSQ